MVPASTVEPAFRATETQLWLGRDAHLVHYPVKAGTQINLVAIVTDRWAEPGWSAEGRRDELLARYAGWSEAARRFLALPAHWQKWALHDLPPLPRWSDGPVTLLGDAAHPMLPFLAQGAAMAIEDAAVLANSLSRHPNDPVTAMQRYEQARRDRTMRVQREARSNGRIYHAGVGAALRNLALRLTGGNLMLHRYDWLYDARLMPPGGR
jgi:salicylate hydroxylase